MIKFSTALEDEILKRQVMKELEELEKCGIPVNQRIYKGLNTNDPKWKISLIEYDNMSVSEIADLLREIYP